MRQFRPLLILKLAAVISSVSIFVVACAPTAPPSGTRAINNTQPAVGSKWVVLQKDSGSYGATSQQITYVRLEDLTWQGRAVRAYSDGSNTRYVDTSTGETVAVVQGTTVLESFDPGVGWNWPLWIGKSWSSTLRYTDHARGRTLNPQFSYKVEAEEDIAVPAGKFKAIRIMSDADRGALVTSTWWSPEIGLTVKARAQRSPQHYLGPGVRETELVSYDAKR